MEELKFDALEIEEVFAEYKLEAKLGKGAFGQVYLVSHRETKEMSALKKIKCFGMDERERNYALNQMRILGSLSHPNLVEFRSGVIDSGRQELYIFLEYVPEGDLAALIEVAKTNSRRIAQNVIWHVLLDISSALEYLHAHQIIHRDVKSANIFCSTHSSYKLGDLNASKITANGSLARTQAGSPLYVSPQVWKETDQGYTDKCDIWSLGIVAYELCLFAVPFEADTIEQLKKKQRIATLKNIPKEYSVTLNQTIHEMLRINPQSRLSAMKLKNRCLGYFKEHEQVKTTEVESLMRTLMFPEVEERIIVLPTVKNPTASSKEKNIKSSNIFGPPIEMKTSSSRSKEKIKQKYANIFAPIDNRSNVFIPRSKQNIPLPPLKKQSESEKSRDKKDGSRKGNKSKEKKDSSKKLKSSSKDNKQDNLQE